MNTVDTLWVVVRVNHATGQAVRTKQAVSEDEARRIEREWEQQFPGWDVWIERRY